jgi:hypothetical protein
MKNDSSRKRVSRFIYFGLLYRPHNYPIIAHSCNTVLQYFLRLREATEGFKKDECKVIIIDNGASSTGNMFSCPSGDYDCVGQLAISEKQAQRCTFYLQRVSAFPLGQLHLEVFCGKIICTRIQFCARLVT